VHPTTNVPVLTPLLYGASVTLAAALSSLLAVVLTGPFIGMGESYEGLALVWYFSLPLAALGGLASTFVYPYYRSRQSWRGVTAVFISNVVAVILCSVAGLLAWTRLFR